MADIYDMNAAIDKPQWANAFAQGRMTGQQVKQNALALEQAQLQQADRNALRTLAPQIVAGDIPAYQQAAAIDPKAAGEYQAAGSAPYSKLTNMVAYIDRAKATGNQAALQAALGQAWPYIRQVAPGAPEQPPSAFTPEMEQGWEALKAKVAMAGQTGDMPTGFRQFQMTAEAAGLVPGTPEYQQAANIALGREGRASSAGFGFEQIRGADGVMRLQRQNPRTGNVEVYDESTGDFLPVGGPSAMGGAPAPVGGAGQVMGAAYAASADPDSIHAMFRQVAPQFGAQITSLTRSPADNARVGGVQNSQHMRGTAGDFVVPPANKGAFQQAMQQQGFEVIDEGDHMHVELPPRGQVAQARANPSLVVGRRPEDEAAAVEGAKQGVQLDYLPQSEAIKAQAATGQAIATERGKQEVEREGVAKLNSTSLRMYEAGMSALRDSMGQTTTGPIIGRIPALTAEQQTAEGSVAAMAPILKGLFRQAGEGTFTDRDQALLLAMIPTRTDLPEAREAKLLNIDQIVRAKLSAQGQSDAPRSTAIKRARNPQTGEVVELRNGAWVPVQ